MSDAGAQLAISVRGIGKRYALGTGREGSSLMDRLGGLFGGSERNPFSDSEVWALKDLQLRRAARASRGLAGQEWIWQDHPGAGTCPG